MNPGNTEAAQSRLYRRILMTSILVGILPGSVSGMIFLSRLRWGTGAVTLLQKEAHGRLQLFGFVLLQIIGVAYHALPRFLGTPVQAPRSAALSFYSLGAASLAWTACLLVNPDAYTLCATLKIFATGAALVGTAAFSHVVFSIVRKASRGRQKSLEIYVRFVLGGTIGWLLAAAVDFIGSLTGGFPVNESVYTLALFSGVLMWTFGMTLRGVAMFMGLQEHKPRAIRISFIALSIGVILAAASPLSQPLGMAVIAVACILFLWGSRVFETPQLKTEQPFRFSLQMRVSHFFLAVFIALSLFWSIHAVTSGVPDQGLLLDGVRHAFVVGYLLLLMTGMMARVMPVFANKSIRLPFAFNAGATLITLGAAQRLLEVVGFFARSPVLVRLSGYSGIWVVTGLVLFLISLIATMTLSAQSQKQAATPNHVAVTLVEAFRIEPKSRLARIECALDTLKPGEVMELINDHDPIPLYYHIQATRAGLFNWTPVEQGPELWRIRIARS